MENARGWRTIFFVRHQPFSSSDDKDPTEPTDGPDTASPDHAATEANPAATDPINTSDGSMADDKESGDDRNEARDRKYRRFGLDAEFE